MGNLHARVSGIKLLTRNLRGSDALCKKMNIYVVMIHMRNIDIPICSTVGDGHNDI